MKQFVLDACALLALLCGEPGREVVTEVFNSADEGTAEILMHKANLLEVYYDILRTYGKVRARETLDLILERPITIIANISDKLFEEAGRLKSLYKVSFADIFALATASVSDGVLLTADHHEMDKVEQSEPSIRFRWIR
jgi:predicted nucleic acid-binding protein